MRHRFGNVRLAVLPRLFLAGATALAVGACDTDELVAVVDPNRLRPEEIDNAAAIPALVQGAIRQFVGGYSGFGGDAFLSASAAISDEFYYGDTFTTRFAADSRNVQPTALGNISDAAFSRLQQARINARRAFAQIVKFSTDATAAADALTQSLLRTIEAYVYVTLSEGWCGSVPFSTIPDTGSIDPSFITPGEPLGTAAMNDTAVVRFDEALAIDPDNQLAMVGKARALLNLGRFDLAAAAVASVPTSFVYLIEHSANTGSQNNPIFSLQGNGRWGLSNLEGGTTSTGAALRPDLASPPASNATAEGLAFRGANDPRIPWEARPPRGLCFSSSVRCFLNDNYPNLDADVPLASGVEARLIEAEAALWAGQPDVMMTKLNELRADVTVILARLYPDQKQVFLTNGSPRGLDPLVDPAPPAGTTAEQFAARRDLLFSERAFWLFNTGHRQGDLRRLARAPYNRPTNQVFPSGPYFRGGSYGNDVGYPVPFDEENNRDFDPASCSTTTP